MRTPRIIQQFEDAVRLHEMKGAMHPDDWDEIEQRYQDKKKQIIKMFRVNSDIRMKGD